MFRFDEMNKPHPYGFPPRIGVRGKLYAGMTLAGRIGQVRVYWALPFDMLSPTSGYHPHPRSATGQALALSHDGRGDKRAFDRLRPNVLPCSHTAVTDTPAWPRARGVTLLRVNGILLIPIECDETVFSLTGLSGFRPSPE